MTVEEYDNQLKQIANTKNKRLADYDSQMKSINPKYVVPTAKVIKKKTTGSDLLNAGKYLLSNIKSGAKEIAKGYVDITLANRELSPQSKSLNNNVTKKIEKQKENISTSLGKTNLQSQSELESINSPFIKKSAEYTGMASKQLPKIIANIINPGVGFAASTFGAFSNYKDDAINRGATDKQANNYGRVGALVEGGTSLLTMGQLKKGATSLAKGKIGKSVTNFALSSAEEAGQEAITEPLMEITSQATIGKSDFNNIGQRMLKAGVDALIVNTILAGAGAGIGGSVNIANKIKQGKQVSNVEIQQAYQESKSKLTKEDTNKAITNYNQKQTDTQIPLQTPAQAPTNQNKAVLPPQPSNVLPKTLPINNVINGSPMITVKDRMKQQIDNTVNTVGRLEADKLETVKSIDTKIQDKIFQLSQKTNQDTKVATNIKKQIELLEKQKKDIGIKYNENIDKVKSKMNDQISKAETTDENIQRLRVQEAEKKLKDVVSDEEASIILSIKDTASYSKDLARNLDNMANGNKEVRNYLFENVEKPLLQGKSQYTENVSNTLNAYKKDMDSLGIKKGSKESQAVQNIGEKQKQDKYGDVKEYTLDMLKTDFPATWQNIVQAEKINRKIYDDYVNKINASLEQIYPNLKDGSESSDYVNKRLLPRKDYYRHFTEISNGLGGLETILSTPTDISSTLAGKSEFTKPKSKFASFMQKRGIGKYTEDAIGGMIQYVPAAEYKINIEPVAAQQRDFIKRLENTTKDSLNANRPIEYLTQFTNDLLGKTNRYDRAFIDRSNKQYKVLEWANNRAKSNAIMGNLGSALSQVLNLPNGSAYIKNPNAWRLGVKDFTMDKIKGNELISQSAFMSERYLDTTFSQFDEGIAKAPEKFANWLLTVGDKRTAEIIWYSAYNDYNLKKGNIKADRDYESAIDYADDITRKSIAGRGIGEVPITQKSKLIKLLAPFQVEVNNQWQLLKERVGKKDILGIGNMVIGSWLLNNLIQAITGNRPGSFDFIDAFIDAMKTISDEEEKRKETEEDPLSLGRKVGIATGRLGGELLSGIPFGNQISSMVTAGNDVTAKKLFGEGDPSRFGTGNIGLSAVTTPTIQYLTGQNVDLVAGATSLLPKWGGKQINKGIKGLQNQGILPRLNLNAQDGFTVKAPIQGSYSQAGRFRMPTDTDPISVVKNLAFGEFSTKAGQDYLKNNKLPYSEIQTKLIEDLNVTGLKPKQSVDFLKTVKEIENDDNLKGIEGAKTQKKANYILSSFTNEQRELMFDNILSKDQKENVQEAVSLGLPKVKAQEFYTSINNLQGEKEFNKKGKEVTIDGSTMSKKASAVGKMNISDEQKNSLLTLAQPNSETPVIYDDIKDLSENSYQTYFALTDKQRTDYKALKELNVKEEALNKYYSEISDIEGVKENGKTISGSKKANVFKYINTLPISKSQKVALFVNAGYDASKYKSYMYDYVNSLKTSKVRKQEIWKALGY